MQTVNDHPFVVKSHDGITVVGDNSIAYPVDILDHLIDHPHTGRALDIALTYRVLTRDAEVSTWLHPLDLEKFIEEAKSKNKCVTILLYSKYDNPYVFNKIVGIEKQGDRVQANVEDGSGVIIPLDEIILAIY
jgi:hypothetical protein